MKGDVNMSLGKRLKLEREKRRWSQLFVAEKIGITNTVLSNYERDYRDPDTDTLKKLANLYDVSVDYLLGRTDNPVPITDKEYDPIEDLKQFMIENNLQDMNLSFFNIEDWKKLNKDDIEEIKRHFEWVVEKAKQREKEDE